MFSIYQDKKKNPFCSNLTTNLIELKINMWIDDEHLLLSSG